MGADDAIVLRGATLTPGTGEVLYGLEVRIDRAGLTQLGGEPVTGWQIPWSACRDVRVGVDDGVVTVALSFGALRYRWVAPTEGIAGGGGAVAERLRELAGARPMVRGVRGAKRRG